MGGAFLNLESGAYIAKCLAQTLKHHLMSICYVPRPIPHGGNTEVSYDEAIGDTQDFHGKYEQADNHAILWQGML